MCSALSRSLVSRSALEGVSVASGFLLGSQSGLDGRMALWGKYHSSS